jgi:hypothetical protein
MNQTEMRGECVTAAQSCRTDPLLVVLQLTNEQKKYGKRAGKWDARIHARENNREKQIKRAAQAQCSSKRVEM